MCGGPDTPEQTPEERALGEIAIERWNDYQNRFVPIEDQYIEDVQKTESDFEDARGKTTAAVNMAFDGAEEKVKDNLIASGVAPDSGQFIKAMDGITEDRGLSLGTGLNESDIAVDTQHLKGLQSVVQMGQGQAGDALDGMGSVAADATRDAIDRAERSFQNRQAGLHLVGNVAGAGAAGYMNSSSPGTGTSEGTFARTDYMHDTGKGGFY